MREGQQKKPKFPIKSRDRQNVQLYIKEKKVAEKYARNETVPAL